VRETCISYLFSYMLNEYERILSFLLQIAPTLVEHVCYDNECAVSSIVSFTKDDLQGVKANAEILLAGQSPLCISHASPPPVD
jgi:hypothetical protein